MGGKLFNELNDAQGLGTILYFVDLVFCYVNTDLLLLERSSSERVHIRMRETLMLCSYNTYARNLRIAVTEKAELERYFQQHGQSLIKVVSRFCLQRSCQTTLKHFF